MGLPPHLQRPSAPPPQAAKITPPPSTEIVAEPSKPVDIVKPGSVMLLGQTGTGKTDAILTLLEAGLEVFVAVTESNGVETLLRSVRRRKLDITKLHWKHCPPTNMSMASMINSADQMNKKAIGDLQKIDSPAILHKHLYRTFINLLKCVENFQCDRTGRTYGDVTEWGDDRAFVIDSLSGVNLMMTQLQVGNRGTLTLPDYNACQLMLEQLIVTLCSSRCFFILTGHLELEKDAISGKIKGMASTIGQKLAPKLPIHFSEVVRARREGAEFFWSTTDPECDLKCRSLPFSDKIKPSFVPVVEAYRADREYAEQHKEDFTYHIEEAVA